MDFLLRLVGFNFLFARFIYWIGLSLERKDTDRKVLLSQFIEASILFGIFVEFFGNVKILPFESSNFISWVGFSFIILGVVISFVAKGQLGKYWTQAAIPKAAKLITKGPYSYIRHPIYTGFILSLIGSQLFVGSSLWISCIFLFIPAYYQAKKEEMLFQKNFKAKSDVYKKHTKMFIPFIF